jgi:uncharacterized membrane protein (UPF0127 family)
MHPGFLAPALSGSPDGLVVKNTRSGLLLAERLEGAFDSAVRRKGLLGRDGLPDGTAFVIAPSNAVHTFFMRFPIDIVFVRRNGQVITVKPNVPAYRIAASLRAFAVIEMAAGGAARADVRPGDCLIIEPRPAVAGP